MLSIASMVLGFGLFVLSLIFQRSPEPVGTPQRVCMLLPKHPLPRLQRLSMHGFGLLELLLITQHNPEPVGSPQRVCMLLPKHPLPRLQRLSMHGFSLLVSRRPMTAASDHILYV